MNVPGVLACVLITAPTLMAATHVPVDLDTVYQVMVIDAMVNKRTVRSMQGQ